PKDVPSGVLAQLGNRVQHALRAFTPDDAKALKAAIATYPHTAYDMQKLLTSLGTGEAVVTVLSAKGVPTPVAWTRMKAPNSLMDPSSQATIDGIVDASQIKSKYADVVDRESAYELLTQRLEAQTPPAADAPAAPQAPASAPAAKPPRAPKEEPNLIEQVAGSTAFKSMLRSAGTVLGREITRSLFGTRKR
ncbi:MAG: DUF853 domain-containing protein, partial [Humibacillus sp.]|nr:DUF853 domain-containing protein [Humibacillus sp.]